MYEFERFLRVIEKSRRPRSSKRKMRGVPSQGLRIGTGAPTAQPQRIHGKAARGKTWARGLSCGLWHRVPFSTEIAQKRPKSP